MALAKDLSDLPKAQGGGNDAWPPDKEIRFGHLLVDRWHREAEDNLPTAVEGAKFRHSDAGKCSRLLAYTMLGIPRSNPVDPAGHFIIHWGHHGHEQWQEVLADAYPGAEVEVTCGDEEMAGHIDAVVTIPSDPVEVTMNDGSTETKGTGLNTVVSIEGKTVGGYAFKKAIGVPPAGRTPHGPSHDHVIQASLNAKAINADEAVVVYWAREAVSQGIAEGKNLGEYGRVTAEWTLTREQYTEIADKEIARVKAIIGMVNDGVLPARKIPSPELPLRHIITNPATGEWVSADDNGVPEDAGTWWYCAYCSHQKICVQTPATRAAVAEVPVIVDLLPKEET